MSVVGGKMGSLAPKPRKPRDYRHVYPYTHTFVAEQRDTLDREECYQAARLDAAESSADKAWRSILQGHEHIRYQIMEIRRALWSMGAGLSPRAKAIIDAMHKSGWAWSDPKPHITLATAQKHLANNIADMPRRWAALYRAEDDQCR